MAGLEGPVTTVGDAQRAADGGAHSIEVSVNLEEDGLTPPLELVENIRRAITAEVHVILRPHNSGYHYGADEITTITEQAKMLVSMGIQGLVFGVYAPEGRLDAGCIRELKAVAPNLAMTIHRAIDNAIRPEESLDDLKGVVSRVLTSGHAATAWEGRHTLRDWVQQFGHDFTFIPAGKVGFDNVEDIMRLTGAPMCHAGSAVRSEGQVDTAKVRRMVDLVAGF
jgi:copper homeostasis protein